MHILVSAIHLPVSCARYCVWALQALGHEVATIGPACGPWLPWAEGRDLRPHEWKPDHAGGHLDGRYWQFDPSAIARPDLLLQFDSLIQSPWDCPNVLYAIDNHVGTYGLYETFDRIFVAHSWGHMADLPQARFLPAAHDPKLHYVIDERAERDIDVLLIGNPYPERVELVTALRAAGINVITRLGPVYGEYNALYNRAKIALVKSKCGDISTRVFENMAQGCFVISDVVRDMLVCGFDDEHGGMRRRSRMGHYLQYTSTAECIDMVRTTLYDTGSCWFGSIIDNARAAIKPHTWQARMQTLLADVGA